MNSVPVVGGMSEVRGREDVAENPQRKSERRQIVRAVKAEGFPFPRSRTFVGTTPLQRYGGTVH